MTPVNTLGLPPPDPRYYRIGGADVSIDDGGTAASNAFDARRNLDVPGRQNDETISGSWTFTGTVVLGTTTVTDAGFSIVDDADATKVLVFSLGGGTTGRTTTIVSSPSVNRTITLPNATTTLAGLAVAQTFTVLQAMDNGLSVSSGTGFYWSIASTGLTADRSYTLPNVATALAGLSAAQTFLATQTFTPATDVVNQIIKAGVGQTANLTEWRDEADALGIYVTAAGGMIFPGVITIDDSASAFLGNFLLTTLTATRNYTFPNATINVLGHFGATTAGRVFFAGASTGLASTDADLSFATDTLTVTKLNAGQATVNSMFGDIVLVGDDPPAVAAGNLGKVDLTAQVANITTTNLSSTPSAGFYEVEVYLMTTTADVTAGTLTVTIGWTDNVGATTSTPITAFTLAATGRTTGRQLIRVASGDITYAVAVTGAYGTSQYAIYVRVLHTG